MGRWKADQEEPNKRWNELNKGIKGRMKEFLFVCSMLSLTQQPSVEKKKIYKRESSLTKCESKQVVR